MKFSRFPTVRRHTNERKTAGLVLADRVHANQLTVLRLESRRTKKTASETGQNNKASNIAIREPDPKRIHADHQSQRQHTEG